MGKITTWAIIVAIVVVFVGGGFTFRSLWPKTVEKVVTVNQTTTIHDTTYIVKASKGFIVYKRDTVYYQDSTTIASYESLIAAMSEQTATVDNPPAGTVSAPVHRFGMGVAAGATYSLDRGTLAPMGGLSLEWKKNEVLLMPGYDKGWTASVVLRRRF